MIEYASVPINHDWLPLARGIGITFPVVDVLALTLPLPNAAAAPYPTLKRPVVTTPACVLDTGEYPLAPAIALI